MFLYWSKIPDRYTVMYLLQKPVQKLHAIHLDRFLLHFALPSTEAKNLYVNFMKQKAYFAAFIHLSFPIHNACLFLHCLGGPK